MVLKQRNAGSRVLEWLMCIRRGAAWFKCMQSLTGNVARAGLASRSADVGQQSRPARNRVTRFSCGLFENRATVLLELLDQAPIVSVASLSRNEDYRHCGKQRLCRARRRICSWRSSIPASAPYPPTNHGRCQTGTDEYRAGGKRPWLLG